MEKRRVVITYHDGFQRHHFMKHDPSHCDIYASNGYTNLWCFLELGKLAGWPYEASRFAGIAGHSLLPESIHWTLRPMRATVPTERESRATCMD